MAPVLPGHRGFQPIAREDSQQASVTAIKALSGIQIALGCLSMVVQGIFTGIILLHMQPEMRHFLVSFGIWAGIVFLTSGIIGLRLRKSHFTHGHDLPVKDDHQRTLATAFLTMNIISAIAAGILIAINVINIFWLSHRPVFQAPFYVVRHADIYLYLPCTGLLLAIGVLELVISAVSASLCCSLRFKCCHRQRQPNRHRIFTDYPSGTMDSASGTMGRRMRSYSQFSLVQPTTPPGQVISNAQVPALPSFTGVPPPPSYDETWNLSQSAVTAVAALSERPSAARSNARLYQNLQTSRMSRTSF